MYLRELLPTVPIWTRGASAPITIHTPLEAHKALGLTRQYWYQVWRGNVPMTKQVAQRLVEATAPNRSGWRMASTSAP